MADDSNNMNFETIIWELQRIEDIQQTQEEIQEELSETTEEVEQVKVSTEDVEKVIGIKESDKKKNVIDGDKLSTTLTTSEKKRYENIGKEFVAGAGKELENVRKAVQFKDAMSTVRNKFSEGVIKFKEGLKKAQKAGSFFGKLMIIIGLLGTIVYIFKDKILKAFPNIGESVTNFFESVKESIPDIIGSALTFVSVGIGSVFSNIIKEMVDDVIPKFIGSFFQTTLPNAIVTLYLGILSAFSGDARRMYNQRLGETIEDDTETIANIAGEEIKSRRAMSEGVIATNNAINNRVNALRDYSEYADLQQALQGVYTVEMLNNQKANDLLGTKDQIGYLDQLVAGNVNFRELIDRGQFDTATFFSKIREANNDNRVTNQEVFNAIRASISDQLKESNDFNVADDVDMSRKSDFAGDLINISQAADGQYNTIRQYITDKENDERQRQNRLNEFRRNVTNINATDVISDELASKFATLVEKIVQFLDGNTIATVLKESFTELNGKFSEFFGEFNTFVEGALGEVVKSIQSMQSQWVSYKVLLDTIRDEVYTLTGDNRTTSATATETPTTRNARDINFNAIVNVQIPQNDKVESISNLVSSVVSVDNQIISAMENTNVRLIQVTNSFTRLNDLHVCSKEYIKGEIEKASEVLQGNITANSIVIEHNNRKINDIENLIKTPVGRPKVNSSMSPCLDVS